LLNQGNTLFLAKKSGKIIEVWEIIIIFANNNLSADN